MNVAWQTAKQTLPAKSKKNEYEEPHGNAAGGGGAPGGFNPFQQGGQAPPPLPPRPQGVRFADQEPTNSEHHELNPFGNPNEMYQQNGGGQNASAAGYGGFQDTGFNDPDYPGYQSGGAYPRQASIASTESSFVGEGGRSDVKINEYQAAWNVTNAIQGMFIVSLPFAVLRGGYWAIIAMVGIAHICCYTGKVGHFIISFSNQLS